LHIAERLVAESKINIDGRRDSSAERTMKRLKSTLDVFVTALVVAAASLVIWRQFVPVAPSRPAQDGPRIEDANGTLPSELATNARGTGPVALVEFADFQCPFCGRHSRDVDPMIRETFVDTGVVRQVFVNYPLPNHPRAQSASEAAICAAKQGKFWEMHDALFRNQAALGHDDLTASARKLGLDVTLFSRCLDGGAALPLIELHKNAGRALAVRGTPAFFLGIVQNDGSVRLKKRINGVVAFSELRSLIIDITPPALKDRIGEAAGFKVPASTGS